MTAFRDGQVTLRENRRTDGFTNAIQEIGYQGIRKGDLVVHGMDGFAGAIGVSDSDGKSSPVVHAYRSNGRVDVRYVAYVLRTLARNDYVVTLAKGIRERSTAFDSATLANVQLPVPPLEEQRRIADFLDAETARIDKLTGLFRHQWDLLVERESALWPIATAGAWENERVVPAGIPGFPLMPAGSQIVPLLRVLQLQRGVDLSSAEWRDGDVPVVTTAGIAGYHDVPLMKGPGVVIGRYGSVGNVHWIEGVYWPHNTTLYVKGFNGNDPKYCYHLLKSLPYEMEQARSAIPGINRNDLHRQQVVLMDYKDQVKIANRLDVESDKFAAARARIEKSQTLLAERRQALITAAVTGEFDVSAASGQGIEE